MIPLIFATMDSEPAVFDVLSVSAPSFVMAVLILALMLANCSAEYASPLAGTLTYDHAARMWASVSSGYRFFPSF